MKYYSNLEEKPLKVGFYKFTAIINSSAEVEYSEKLGCFPTEKFSIDLNPLFELASIRPQVSYLYEQTIHVTYVSPTKPIYVHWILIDEAYQNLTPNPIPATTGPSILDKLKLYEQMKADTSIEFDLGVDDDPELDNETEEPQQN